MAWWLAAMQKNHQKAVSRTQPKAYTSLVEKKQPAKSFIYFHIIWMCSANAIVWKSRWVRLDNHDLWQHIDYVFFEHLKKYLFTRCWIKTYYFVHCSRLKGTFQVYEKMRTTCNSWIQLHIKVEVLPSINRLDIMIKKMRKCIDIYTWYWPDHRPRNLLMQTTIPNGQQLPQSLYCYDEEKLIC